MKNKLIYALGLISALTLTFNPSLAQEKVFMPQVIDLTHTMPTFKPLKDDPTKADLNQPWLGSKPIPTLDKQTVLTATQWGTNQGYFDLVTITIGEHHGTHVDAPSHFVNNAESSEKGGLPRDQIKMMAQVDVKQLVGKIVLIDISARVRKELTKNGGVPSNDISVTDFSESTQNVITVQDIEAVEDQIVDGVWLVFNLGWSQFFNTGETDWAKSPYMNNWNHPGLSRAATDKLIEIMERKKVKIAGIAADNIGLASGESSKGDDDQWSNSWREHVRLQQRQIMILENATNLDELSTAMSKNNGNCMLVVGALKNIRSSGSPIRLLALCS